jgi:hypothetical protein
MSSAPTTASAAAAPIPRPALELDRRCPNPSAATSRTSPTVLVHAHLGDVINAAPWASSRSPRTRIILCVCGVGQTPLAFAIDFGVATSAAPRPMLKAANAYANVGFDCLAGLRWDMCSSFKVDAVILRCHVLPVRSGRKHHEADGFICQLRVWVQRGERLRKAGER